MPITCPNISPTLSTWRSTNTIMLDMAGHMSTTPTQDRHHSGLLSRGSLGSTFLRRLVFGHYAIHTNSAPITSRISRLPVRDFNNLVGIALRTSTSIRHHTHKDLIAARRTLGECSLRTALRCHRRVRQLPEFSSFLILQTRNYRIYFAQQRVIGLL
jgi:hypothetical protein